MRSSVRFRMAERPGSRKHFGRSPLLETANVLTRLNHVARFIVNANHTMM